jgi:hypothetical protein
MRATCTNEARAAADDPPLPKHFEDFDSYVKTQLAEARTFLKAVDLPRVPASLSSFHGRLLATAGEEVTLLEKMDRAAARFDRPASFALAADFGRLDRKRDEDAAWLGLPDCVRAPGADAARAYPRAPHRGGQSALSRLAFLKAVDGICGDNATRGVWGRAMIREYPDQTGNERRGADRRFVTQIHLRLRRLLARLGTAPGGIGRVACRGSVTPINPS